VRGRLRGEEQRRVHVVEVLAHRRERRRVRRLADRLDHRLVTDAEAEHEPTGIRLLDRPPTRVRGHRVARVERDDAGRDDEVGGGTEDERRVHHRVAVHRLRQPQRAESELLDLQRDVVRLRPREQVERARPEADASRSIRPVPTA
jgi:hypothetical protein